MSTPHDGHTPRLGTAIMLAMVIGAMPALGGCWRDPEHGHLHGPLIYEKPVDATYRDGRPPDPSHDYSIHEYEPPKVGWTPNRTAPR